MTPIVSGPGDAFFCYLRGRSSELASDKLYKINKLLVRLSAGGPVFARSKGGGTSRGRTRLLQKEERVPIKRIFVLILIKLFIKAMRRVHTILSKDDSVGER